MLKLTTVRREYWIVACVLAALLAAAWITRPRDTTYAAVRKSGTIRFGTDPNYMPFEGLAASGEFTGMDIDLGREVARKLRLKAEFAMLGSDGLYDALGTRHIDAVISALVPDPTRRWSFAYSVPYFDAGLVFVVPAQAGQDWGRNLKGRTLAVEMGSESDARARWLARRTADLRVMELDTPDEAVLAVERGAADATLADTATARQIAADHPALRVGARQTSTPFVIAVRADAPELLGALNGALEQLKADGTLDAIIDRWLDADR